MRILLPLYLLLLRIARCLLLGGQLIAPESSGHHHSGAGQLYGAVSATKPAALLHVSPGRTTCDDVGGASVVCGKWRPRNAPTAPRETAPRAQWEAARSRGSAGNDSIVSLQPSGNSVPSKRKPRHSATDRKSTRLNSSH